MARRITIEIKVEEQRDRYSWSTLSESEMVSSIELFSPAAAAAAIVAGVEQLIGLATVESQARDADPVFQRAAARDLPSELPDDAPLADEAVPA